MKSTFTKQIVDTTMDQTHAVVAADLDGDNDIDLVATHFIFDYVAWYENDGQENFNKRLIDGNLNGSIEGSILEGAYPVNVGDVNGDGNIDVLATGYEADTAVWYENDGNGGFTRRDVDTNADGAHSIVAGDLDKDGDTDLLTTNQDAGTVTWYENDGSENFTLRVVDENLGRAKYADLADVDGDGDIDLFAAGDEEGIIAWYENDGSQNFSKQIIDDSAEGAYFTFATDLNGDGFIDVVTASQNENTISWYANDGSGNFTKQIIDNSAEGARSVYVVDLDDDGNLDVLSASVDIDTVAWYRHDGSGNFTKQIIDDAADGAYGVFAADVDGDGLTDVLSASRDDDTIAWYRQTRTLNTPIYRFQSNAMPGTYLFVGEEEKQNINQNFANDFIEEGIAFTAATEPDDDLMPLFRFQSTQQPGTYLFVAEEERNSINADPNLSSSFTEEGLAFYVYGAGAGEETPFIRFQNSLIPGTYLYATGAEADNIRLNFPNYVEEGNAFEARI